MVYAFSYKMAKVVFLRLEFCKKKKKSSISKHAKGKSLCEMRLCMYSLLDFVFFFSFQLSITIFIGILFIYVSGPICGINIVVFILQTHSSIPSKAHMQKHFILYQRQHVLSFADLTFYKRLRWFDLSVFTTFLINISFTVDIIRVWKSLSLEYFPTKHNSCFQNEHACFWIESGTLIIWKQSH